MIFILTCKSWLLRKHVGGSKITAGTSEKWGPVAVWGNSTRFRWLAISLNVRPRFREGNLSPLTRLQGYEPRNVAVAPPWSSVPVGVPFGGALVTEDMRLRVYSLYPLRLVVGFRDIVID